MHRLGRKGSNLSVTNLYLFWRCEQFGHIFLKFLFKWVFLILITIGIILHRRKDLFFRLLTFDMFVEFIDLVLCCSLFSIMNHLDKLMDRLANRWSNLHYIELVHTFTSIDAKRTLNSVAEVKTKSFEEDSTSTMLFCLIYWIAAFFIIKVIVFCWNKKGKESA